ncbi:MAG: PQQ-binding-like beta-propeller repeat protein [Planctomycetes bacterium]|nr:PQQ-binding-like beta-propeller repeat protein [Planctomycetota bacterium]
MPYRFRRLISSSFALLTLITTSLPATAADWTEFRGPSGQGLATAKNLPLEWNAKKNVAWKIPLPGKGWSSPVLAKGRLYLTTAVPVESSKENDMTLRALCVDAKSGRLLWNVLVFDQDGAKAPRIQGKNSHASPTPLIEGNRLYVHFGHQGTACLDTAGKVLWRNRELKYPPNHGNGSSPILVDGAIVLSCDGSRDPFLAALDARTGKLRWKSLRKTTATRKFSFCTPLVITVDGKQQIISPGSDTVGAFDPQTGREIWRVTYIGYSVVPRPVFGHGLVFISTSFNTPQVMAIRPDGQGDVTKTHVAWTLKKGAPHTPSLLLVGEELYLVSDRGIASCLDAVTGKVHWQERVEGNYSASPIYAQGRIYLQSERGRGIVLAAETKFRKLADNPLEERTLASYAVDDDALFIRTAEHLYRISK